MKSHRKLLESMNIFVLSIRDKDKETKGSIFLTRFGEEVLNVEWELLDKSKELHIVSLHAQLDYTSLLKKFHRGFSESDEKKRIRLSQVALCIFVHEELVELRKKYDIRTITLDAMPSTLEKHGSKRSDLIRKVYIPMGFNIDRDVFLIPEFWRKRSNTMAKFHKMDENEILSIFDKNDVQLYKIPMKTDVETFVSRCMEKETLITAYIMESLPEIQLSKSVVKAADFMGYLKKEMEFDVVTNFYYDPDRRECMSTVYKKSTNVSEIILSLEDNDDIRLENVVVYSNDVILLFHLYAFSLQYDSRFSTFNEKTNVLVHETLYDEYKFMDRLKMAHDKSEKSYKMSFVEFEKYIQVLMKTREEARKRENQTGDLVNHEKLLETMGITVLHMYNSKDNKEGELRLIYTGVEILSVSWDLTYYDDGLYISRLYSNMGITRTIKERHRQFSEKDEKMRIKLSHIAMCLLVHTELKKLIKEKDIKTVSLEAWLDESVSSRPRDLVEKVYMPMGFYIDRENGDYKGMTDEEVLENWNNPKTRKEMYIPMRAEVGKLTKVCLEKEDLIEKYILDIKKEINKHPLDHREEEVVGFSAKIEKKFGYSLSVELDRETIQSVKRLVCHCDLYVRKHVVAQIDCQYDERGVFYIGRISQMKLQEPYVQRDETTFFSMVYFAILQLKRFIENKILMDATCEIYAQKGVFQLTDSLLKQRFTYDKAKGTYKKNLGDFQDRLEARFVELFSEGTSEIDKVMDNADVNEKLREIGIYKPENLMKAVGLDVRFVDDGVELLYLNEIVGFVYYCVKHPDHVDKDCDERQYKDPTGLKDKVIYVEYMAIAEDVRNVLRKTHPFFTPVKQENVSLGTLLFCLLLDHIITFKYGRYYTKEDVENGKLILPETIYLSAEPGYMGSFSKMYKYSKEGKETVVTPEKKAELINNFYRKIGFLPDDDHNMSKEEVIEIFRDGAIGLTMEMKTKDFMNRCRKEDKLARQLVKIANSNERDKKYVEIRKVLDRIEKYFNLYPLYDYTSPRNTSIELTDEVKQKVNLVDRFTLEILKGIDMKTFHERHLFSEPLFTFKCNTLPHDDKVELTSRYIARLSQMSEQNDRTMSISLQKSVLIAVRCILLQIEKERALDEKGYVYLSVEIIVSDKELKESGYEDERDEVKKEGETKSVAVSAFRKFFKHYKFKTTASIISEGEIAKLVGDKIIDKQFIAEIDSALFKNK